MVVDRRDQVEAQAEAPAPVAVALAQDAEDFQAPNDVLGHEPLPRQVPVLCLLRRRQRMKLAALVWRPAVGMLLDQAQIAAVREAPGLRPQRRPAALEELEVVRLARAEGGRDDLPGSLVGDYLGLLGVALLLAAITSALLFWGRSTGHSVASMTTT